MRWLTVLVGVLIGSAAAVAQTSTDFPVVEKFPHSQEFSSSGPQQREYLLGLGALQKVGGRWRHRESASVDGQVLSQTWQVNEAFTAEEAYLWLRQQMPDTATLLFECEGRSCGRSAQWASRVFSERVLYGHDDRQQYSAWELHSADALYVVVLYASDRANRRHFVRLDLIRPDDQLLKLSKDKNSLRVD